MDAEPIQATRELLLAEFVRVYPHQPATAFWRAISRRKGQSCLSRPEVPS